MTGRITDVEAIQSARRVFVKITTDDGLVGWGEGTGFVPRAVAGMVEELAPYVVGEEASRISLLWQEVFRRPFVRGGPVTGCAVAAIDLALWDIKGKTLGAPVHELLGGLARDRVRLYGHVRGDSPEQLAAAARELADDGVTVIRFRGFHDTDAAGVHDHAEAVRQQVACTEAVRDAVGAGVDLILECHGRYPPEHAVKLAKQVERFDLLFVEDPVRHENPDGLRHVRRHTSVPLATGERCHSKWEFRELIQDRLIDYARPDVCWAGGISEFVKIAALAETYDVDLVPHNTQGPLGSAATIHASLAIPNVAVAEAALFAGPAPADDPAVRPWPVVSEGYALPPTAPGLGVVVDEELLAPPGSPRRGHPVLRAPDGAVRDW